MKTNTHLLLTVAAITITSGVWLSSTPAFAQGPATNASGNQNQRQSLIQKLSTKFGLNQDHVKAFFEQERDERRDAHQAAYTAQLTQWVNEGKIKESEKQLIIAKMTELEAGHEARQAEMQNKTPAERQAARQTHRQEIINWAKEKGIDPQYLPFGQSATNYREGNSAGMGRGHKFFSKS